MELTGVEELEKAEPDWRRVMALAVRLYLKQTVEKYKGNGKRIVMDHEHIVETPRRVVRAYEEYIAGCYQDPAMYLERQFATQEATQMIHSRSVRIRSMCMHHLCPIVGRAHFAYLPDKNLVGFSKIPRMIRSVARRPQLQESLGNQIVDVFQEIVKPLGCGVNIRAYHFCVLWRGVEEDCLLNETTALKGSFLDHEPTRQEFLNSLDKSEVVFP